MFKHYTPLYPPEGQPFLGFACKVPMPDEKYPEGLCGKVTKTEIGMHMHLKRVHGIEVQGELFERGDSNGSGAGVPKRDSGKH